MVVLPRPVITDFLRVWGQTEPSLYIKNSVCLGEDVNLVGPTSYEMPAVTETESVGGGTVI